MSGIPPLIVFPTAEEYQVYYTSEFCRNTLTTYDGLRVYFSPGRFWHAFCVRDSKGKKDQFCFDRAKYIGWIRPTLENPNAKLFQGWNNTIQQSEPHRRVSLVYEKFVVVLEIALKQNGTLKANFITAFYADRSIGKIISSTLWSREACLTHLNGVENE